MSDDLDILRELVAGLRKPVADVPNSLYCATQTELLNAGFWLRDHGPALLARLVDAEAARDRCAQAMLVAKGKHSAAEAKLAGAMAVVDAAKKLREIQATRAAEEMEYHEHNRTYRFEHESEAQSVLDAALARIQSWGRVSMEYRDRLEILKARFFERYIGDRTPLQLANDLWSIYLACRSNLPHELMAEDDEGDTGKLWPEAVDAPDDLALADIIDKRICRVLYGRLADCEE